MTEVKVLNDVQVKETTKDLLDETTTTTTNNNIELSNNIQKLIKRVKGEFMMSDCVNYELLKKSELFQQFVREAGKLNRVDLESYTQSQRKAFFINVYNTLTIHGVLMEDKLPDSVLGVKQFWQRTAYRINGHIYSLDDIEHGILRANNPHPSSHCKPFQESDPRLKFSMDTLDPRIHFALNCGAKSCPVISAYNEDNLETGLTSAAQSFCSQEVIVLPKNEEVYVSKLFEWYESDFGINDIAAVRWILNYLDGEKKQQLSLLLHAMESIGAGRIRYNEYDWSLNSTFR